MRNAIFELRCIGKSSPGQIDKEIEVWIARNIKEVSIRLSARYILALEDRDLLINKGICELGVAIAEHANMHPIFENQGDHIECRLGAMVLVNEYGK